MSASAPPEYAELTEHFRQISDLGRTQGLLAWDERTMMPAAAATGRAEQSATIARVIHERLIDDRLWELIESLSGWVGGEAAGSLEADAVRVARRECERARRVPTELRAEMARAASAGENAWAKARADDDLASFLPFLARNVELRRSYSDCFAPFDHPYDPLLDDYEPGLPTAEARRLLGELRAGLVPIAAAIAENSDAVDDALLRGHFDPDGQRRVVAAVIGGLPLEAGTWRLDPTTHPFALSVNEGDVRLTTKYVADDLSYGLFSALHEAGHGMYEAGVATELRRGPLGEPTSLAFHESQSRLWENWVGRSRPFLASVLPLLAEEFPAQFGAVGAEDLYRAANRVAPSLVRVEADEVTYNLHIALRFELELALFDGELEVGDLAEAWRERTRHYLGIEVPDDVAGVLQDVHWSAGLFGYFPTYALGNVIAAQLWERAAADLGDLDELIAAGDLGALGTWLGEHVHRHGGRWPGGELAQRALGGPLDPAPLLRRLETKFGELYGF